MSILKLYFFSSHSNKPNFSQVTLNKYGITYIHDDSETTSDSFTFRTWVAPFDPSSFSSPSSAATFSSDSSSSSFHPPYSASSTSLSSLDTVSFHHVKDSLAVTETFNITVTPVNDHSPLIRSRNPRMKVVEGERVVVGSEYLQVGQCLWKTNSYSVIESYSLILGPWKLSNPSVASFSCFIKIIRLPVAESTKWSKKNERNIKCVVFVPILTD